MASKYKLFVFTDEELSDGEMAIDFAPSTWISFDQDKGMLVCKFMPPPYTKKSVNMLDTMRKNLDHPLSGWPNYAIEIRGDAGKLYIIMIYIIFCLFY